MVGALELVVVAHELGEVDAAVGVRVGGLELLVQPLGVGAPRREALAQQRAELVAVEHAVRVRVEPTKECAELVRRLLLRLDHRGGAPD